MYKDLFKISILRWFTVKTVFPRFISIRSLDRSINFEKAVLPEAVLKNNNDHFQIKGISFYTHRYYRLNQN